MACSAPKTVPETVVGLFLCQKPFRKRFLLLADEADSKGVELLLTLEPSPSTLRWVQSLEGLLRGSLRFCLVLFSGWLRVGVEKPLESAGRTAGSLPHLARLLGARRSLFCRVEKERTHNHRWR